MNCSTRIKYDIKHNGVCVLANTLLKHHQNRVKDGHSRYCEYFTYICPYSGCLVIQKAKGKSEEK
jgi:hypothetical protein